MKRKRVSVKFFNELLQFPKQVNIEWPPTKSNQEVEAHPSSQITVKALKATELQ